MAKTLKRNKNGEGSIKLRKDGRLEGRIYDSRVCKQMTFEEVIKLIQKQK